MIFFNKIHYIKFNKSAKRLDGLIFNGFLINLAETENHHNGTLSQFAFCASYFSRCYAYSRGNKFVTINDIADGWILTFKLFLNDLRPFIDGLDANSPYAFFNIFKFIHGK